MSYLGDSIVMDTDTGRWRKARDGEAAQGEIIVTEDIDRCQAISILLQPRGDDWQIQGSTRGDWVWLTDATAHLTA